MSDIFKQRMDEVTEKNAKLIEKEIDDLFFGYHWFGCEKGKGLLRALKGSWGDKHVKQYTLDVGFFSFWFFPFSFFTTES